MDDKNSNNEASLDSLEGPSTVVETEPTASTDASTTATTPSDSLTANGTPVIGSNAATSAVVTDESLPATPKKHRIVSFLKHFNIYLVIFGILLTTAVVIVVISFLHNKSATTDTPLTTQSLSQDTLNQLKNSQTTLGDPKQILSVESNTVFAGTILVKQGVDVAGEIRTGGALSAASVSATGNSAFNQLQANSVTITGDATIQKTLAVTGGGTFGGTLSAPTLSVNTLQLNGDLQLNHHLDAGGGTPSKTNGNALGNGGTTSVSGTDTAGTITINTGSSPAAGCFITVNFTQKFNDTPHVTVSPIGSSAAGISYYLNRSATSFSVCTTTAAPASSNFSFDYIVID